MKNLQNSKKGFTLIEAIVSIAILAIISIMFVTVLGSSLRISGTSNAQNKDSLKAQENLEESIKNKTPATEGGKTSSFDMTFTINGKGFSTSTNNMYEGKDSDSNVIYRAFEVKANE